MSKLDKSCKSLVVVILRCIQTFVLAFLIGVGSVAHLCVPCKASEKVSYSQMRHDVVKMVNISEQHNPSMHPGNSTCLFRPAYRMVM